MTAPAGSTNVFALAPLPLESWVETKTTLHLWAQIIGKIRLRTTPHVSQWWNATLRISPRGLLAQGMHSDGRDFDLELDFIEHKLVGRTATGERASFQLEDGLSVAAFYAQTMELLSKLGLHVRILARPYGVPIQTPFSEDIEHHHYDAAAARRWWDIARFAVRVLDQHATNFAGKQSPAHLFWHSFDIAQARFSGRPAPAKPAATVVEQEAYFYEVIAAGFWAGDERIPAPTFYTYTAPEPPDLTAQPLRPAGAQWSPAGPGHLGIIPYETIRAAADPATALLDFLQSGYEAGVKTAAWPQADLVSHFAQLQQTVTT